MKLYELIVSVTSGEKGPSPSAHYMLMAYSADNTEKWDSNLLSKKQYRTAMSGTGLTDTQIEGPIRTGHQTVFGGQGGGDLMLSEGQLLQRGMNRIRD